jgi:4-amino-4-deoxy-L-arabinose transferase-like glycosyltransferase
MRGMVSERPLRPGILTGWLARLAAWPRLTLWLTVATALLVGGSIYIIQSYRLGLAPDIFVDEVTYFYVGKSIAQGDGMRQYWFSPEHVFFWHPPLFFLLEAAVLRVVNPLLTDAIAAIVVIRYLNVFLSAVTGGLLFLLGRRLRDAPTGLFMALLFACDPFILRSARRNLLEILLMVLMVGGVLLLSYYPRGLDRRGALGLGVLFGLTMLTKEIAFYILLLPALLVVLGQPAVLAALVQPLACVRGLLRPWRWRAALRSVALIERTGPLWRSLRWVVLCGVVSIAIYAFYPLWAWSNGYWQDFWSFRTYQFSRFEGSIQASGWNSGGRTPSFVEALGTNIPLYGTSYALIVLGTIMGAFLILRSWRDIGARLLAGWFLLSSMFFAFVILRGQLNDQFFYMLIIPNAACVGYGTPLILQAAGRSVRRHKRRFAAALLLTVLLSGGIFTNGVLYYNAYAVGVDNGYERIRTYLLANVPTGTPLLIGGDVGIHLFPEYPTYLLRTEQEVYDHHVHYFILSSKEAWGNFDGVTQEFYDWVRTNAVEQYAIDETTFWHFAVYYMAYPEESPRKDETNGPVVTPPPAPSSLQLAARPIPPYTDTDTKRYFTTTGHGISGSFKRFWETRGGLPIFGYPLTEPFAENGRLVQYFERVRLEQDPAQIGTEREIQIADLGSEITATRRDSPPFLPVDPATATDRTFFAATGHTLAGPFRSYWEQQGGEAIFGAPISEIFDEVNPADGRTYRVQYFQRAQFVVLTDNGGAAPIVAIGALGRQTLLDRGWRP